MTNPEIGKHPESVIVPELLRDDQNLLDQPPFYWIRENPLMVPTDLFLPDREDFGWPMLVHATADVGGSALQYLKRRQRELLHATLDLQWRPVKNEVDKLKIIGDKIYKALRQYPHSVTYLKEMWVHHYFFDEQGKRKKPGIPIRTYAAYAAIKDELMKKDKWIGLEEVLPAHFETEDTVTKIGQGKPETNRYFRIVKRSEFLS